MMRWLRVLAFWRKHRRKLAHFDRYRLPNGEIDWRRWADEHGEPFHGRGME